MARQKVHTSFPQISHFNTGALSLQISQVVMVIWPPAGSGTVNLISLLLIIICGVGVFPLPKIRSVTIMLATKLLVSPSVCGLRRCPFSPHMVCCINLRGLISTYLIVGKTTPPQAIKTQLYHNLSSNGKPFVEFL